jgi:hypothetical protein
MMGGFCLTCMMCVCVWLLASAGLAACCLARGLRVGMAVHGHGHGANFRIKKLSTRGPLPARPRGPIPQYITSARSRRGGASEGADGGADEEMEWQWQWQWQWQ